MIFSFDSITLSFLVVASVTLAVVVVLVWYVYSNKKFKQDMIKLMDEKLNNYLDNIEPPVQEAEEETETEKTKDECEFAEKFGTLALEVEQEEPHPFVEKPFVEQSHE